jgi:hypothetical protein
MKAPLGDDGGKCRRGPSLSSKLLVFSAWMPACCSPLNGGAARRVGGPGERARSAVTQNIRSTLKRLVQALPALDEPLARRIRTGAFCAYEPDPSRPVVWQL